MDQDRQIRFVIPPFFLLANLLWGAYLGECNLEFLLKPESTREFLSLLAATTVAVVPLGYLISTISITLLTIVTWMFGKPTYEAVFDPQTLNRVWQRIEMPGDADSSKTLYAAATYDHECLSPGMHMWIFRRWTSFNLAIHSIVAILLAHAVALVLSVPHSGKWIASTVGLAIPLALTGGIVWRQVMAMIKFQLDRPPKTTSDRQRSEDESPDV